MEFLKNLKKKKRPTEMDRILGLPSNERLPPLKLQQADLLLETQRQALSSLQSHPGLIGALGVGSGKTLVGLLAPQIVGAEKALIMMPASMIEPYYAEALKFSEPLDIDMERIQLMSYGKLSTKNSTDLLNEIRPDCIICDECHYLKNMGSNRTRRLRKYLRSRPTEDGRYSEVIFIALSGTLMNRSIKEFAHLSLWALGDKTPLPTNWPKLDEWSQILDPGGFPARGAKRRFQPLMDKHGTDDVHQAFSKHFSTRVGVVVSAGVVSCDSTLVLRKREIQYPESVRKNLEFVEQWWELPNSEMLIDDPMRLAKVKAQIAQGFYYVWEWPNGEPDWPWLEAKRAWGRAVRAYLKRPRDGIDSAGLLKDACKAGNPPNQTCREAWKEWSKHIHKPEPETVPVWFSKYLIKDAIAWLRQDKRSRVIWYDDRATQEALREEGIPIFGSGDGIPEKAPQCAMSISVNGKGQNLQRYDHGLILTPMRNGGQWEQLLGRFHREGQKSDEVWYEYYWNLPPFEEAFEGAIEDATTVQKDLLTPQRLLLANVTKAPRTAAEE